jgi:RNA polymerase sigma factor (TIGR02999 family)
MTDRKPQPDAVTRREPAAAGRAAGEVTALLLRWQAGDPQALDALMPLVYAELRRLAARQLRGERAGHTLQPTAVVHEAYLRLIGQRNAGWQSRGQFYAVAARMMRRVLIDHARRGHAGKRGGAAIHLSLEGTDLPVAAPSIDLLALDAALTRLEALDAEQARVVELRFFAGLSVEETALALGLSPATIKRYWQSARAWLYRELAGAPA